MECSGGNCVIRRFCLVSNYYINLLANKAKKDLNARWKLGELLHQAAMEGCEIIQDKKTGNIEIRKKEVFE